MAECWAVHLVAYLALWSVGTRAGLSVGTMVDKKAAESAGSLGVYLVDGLAGWWVSCSVGMKVELLAVLLVVMMVEEMVDERAARAVERWVVQLVAQLDA